MVTQPPAEAQAWIRGSAPEAIVDFYIPRGNQGIPGLPGARGPIGPSATVGSVLTTTGPAAPGTIGATGLTGAKGDPGGITLGTLLSTNHLDTIKTPGIYRQDSGTPATLANGYPVAATGILYVDDRLGGSASVMQTFYPFTGSSGIQPRRFYKRYLVSSTIWGTWECYTANRVDQSAGRVIYAYDDLNAREQLIYGDTGWRDVSASLTSGWTGGLHIRRIGAMLHVSVRSVVPPTATPTGQFFVWPAGFAPDITGTYIPVRPDSSVTLTSLYFDTNGLTHNVLGSAWSSNMGSLVGNFSFPISAAWPTALPGNAYGSIPNI